MLLGELLTIKYGKNQSKVVADSGYPIYGTGGIISYSKDYLYDGPSILIGRKGSIENVQYVDKPFWCVDTTFYTIVNEDLVIPKYLFYKLSLIDFKIYDEGTTIPSLRTDTLNKIKIKIHSYEMQQHIVDIGGIL
jgi:type I restriction enzyme S subunit